MSHNVVKFCNKFLSKFFICYILYFILNPALDPSGVPTAPLILFDTFNSFSTLLMLLEMSHLVATDHA